MSGQMKISLGRAYCPSRPPQPPADRGAHNSYVPQALRGESPRSSSQQPIRVDRVRTGQHLSTAENQSVAQARHRRRHVSRACFHPQAALHNSWGSRKRDLLRERKSPERKGRERNHLRRTCCAGGYSVCRRRRRASSSSRSSRNCGGSAAAAAACADRQQRQQQQERAFSRILGTRERRAKAAAAGSEEFAGN